MSVRRLVLAIQFLTRLPTPQVRDFRDDDLSRAAVYYPLVGVIIGALHLDGLGDVADAFGAAHRDPQRFLEVLKDPHMGVFGVVSLVMQLLLKFVLLAELSASPLWYGIVLVPAWARWGTLWWSRLLPSLHGAGMAERFSWQLSLRSMWVWALLLAVVTAFVAWPLLLALPLVALIAAWWRRRLGGISGDCLGASVEVTESLLLLALVLLGGVERVLP